MLPLSDPDLVTRKRPYVNVGLIIACVLVFIYELSLNATATEYFFYQYGFIPAAVAQGIRSVKDKLSDGSIITIPLILPAWLTIFTSIFLHGGWLHVAGNMLYLWVFGDNVEDRFGHLWYLIFYLATGVIASLTQIFAAPSSTVPNIGASGAIAGALGAYFVLFPYSRVRTLVVIFIFPLFLRIPSVILLGFWFFLQFISGVGSIGPSAQAEGIAYWAHVGGFVSGVAVALIYRLMTRNNQPKRPETPFSL